MPIDNWRDCELCGEFGFITEDHDEILRHVCKPQFEVREDGDDEWRACRATDHGDAAQDFAHWVDAIGDNQCINGERLTLHVRKAGEEETKRFFVTGEMIPHYTATEFSTDSNGLVQELDAPF